MAIVYFEKAMFEINNVLFVNLKILYLPLCTSIVRCTENASSLSITNITALT